MIAPAEPTKVCARCKVDLPLSTFDSPARKNCIACAQAEAARRAAPKVPKPEGWEAPRPGKTPMQRCEACEVEKVYSAFPERSNTCRQCAAAAASPAPEEKADAGKRPTIYTPALGTAIAERIAMGETLASITADPSMPSRERLARWRLEFEDLAEMLALARGARADARADEIADLVEAVRTGRVDAQAGRVAIDGLRWLASKDDPRRYGDRVELSNPDGSLKANVAASVAIEALIAALPELVGALAQDTTQELLPSPQSGDGAAAAGVGPSAPAADLNGGGRAA